MGPVVGNHDLVVVIGAPAFTEHVVTVKNGPDLPPLILLHDDEQVLARAPHAIAVRATPGAGIRHLVGAVAQSTSTASVAAAERVAVNSMVRAAG